MTKIILKERLLIIKLPKVSSVLSWAPFNGGITESNCIFNHECGDFEENSLNKIFDNIVKQNDLPFNSVGLVTGAKVSRYEEVFLRNGALWVHAIGTVGLNNARTVGDSADVVLNEAVNKPGTINLIISCNALPQVSGLVEATHIAAMAKTAAVMEAEVMSKKSNQIATGTGTDCIVMAGNGEIQENYCGMHTILGEMIGNAVKEIVIKGIQNWPNS